ncbi:MAG: preprotein translocase subunit SecG [Rubrivivax sp.]
MQILLTLLIVVQILAALVIIGLVLVQNGNGADMGASFGSGSSGSLFGATGSANFLSRSTAVAATVFFVATLGLAYMNTHGAKPDAAGGSVLDKAPTPAGAASAAPGTIPTAPAVVPTAPATPAAPGATPAGTAAPAANPAIPAAAAPAASK